ncbi:hypothetical protein CPB86DRAFT_843815 [Serendipita vermifera]|nr:hypothetical protein CPB86DRAFT_843815 [Serendipita vermifera]
MASQPNEGSPSTLPEQLVMLGFHKFLVNALSQAKLEKLIDEDTLASAEADVMICGPALCLYFAALRSNTTPPSVPIPGSSRSAQPLILSANTCPPVFQSFFRLWSQCVPDIQGLPSEQQHDLARIICDKEPLNTPAPPILNRLAADIRSVAIEITQRRTFQERYKADLQGALDAGIPTASEKRRVAAFAPPPSYDESSQNGHSPTSSVHSSPQRHPVSLPVTPSRLNAALPATPNAASHPEGMASIEGTLQPSQDQTHLAPNSAAQVVPPSPPVASSSRPRPASPTLLPPDGPAINLIRETLYAALGEVIASNPAIKGLLVSDPARAYFSSVGLAILTVGTDCVTHTGSVITPLGKELTLEECPGPYRPLMMELGNIGKQAKAIVEEDNDKAIAAVRAGLPAPEPRIERLRRMLEHGVAREEERYNSYTPAPAANAPSGLVEGRGVPPAMPVPTILSTTNAVPTLTSAATRTEAPPLPPRRSLEQDQHLQPPTRNSPPTSTTSSPRTSSEQPRGLHNLLHKKRPVSAERPPQNVSTSNASSSDPPVVAPKPIPPSSRPAGTSTAPLSPPMKYPAPKTPPPTRTSESEGAGMAGVGAGAGHLTGGPNATTPQVAMMAHQTSLRTTGNPYESAMGSGAQIPGHDSGAVQAGAMNASPPPPTSTAQATSEPASNPRRSLEGSTVQFANRINGLALNLTRLRMFQERQDMVFKILASVHD